MASGYYTYMGSLPTDAHSACINISNDSKILTINTKYVDMWFNIYSTGGYRCPISDHIVKNLLPKSSIVMESSPTYIAQTDCEYRTNRDQRTHLQCTMVTSGRIETNGDLTKIHLDSITDPLPDPYQPPMLHNQLVRLTMCRPVDTAEYVTADALSLVVEGMKHELQERELKCKAIKIEADEQSRRAALTSLQLSTLQNGVLFVVNILKMLLLLLLLVFGTVTFYTTGVFRTEKPAFLLLGRIAAP